MNITEKILKYSLIFTFFILALSFLIFPLTDLDMWMHLVTGKYIVENLKIPTSDFYSYTAFGRPWIDHEWLGQIIFYAFYQWDSYNGLIILRIIIFLLIFLTCFIALAKKTNYFLAILAIFLALLVSHNRFFLRPEVFTLLFTLLYIIILEQYQIKPSKLIYILPLLQILWVNLHGYFLLGWVLPLLFLAGQLFKKEGNSSTLLIVVLLIILASFINPYTYQGAVYPFKILASLGGESRSVLKDISELKSPFMSGGSTVFWLKVLIAFSAFSFLLAAARRTLNLSRLFLYILFLILGLSVQRHLALFAFPVSLVTFYNLGEIKKNHDFFSDFEKLKIFFKPLKISILFFAVIYFLFFTYQIASNRFYLKERILKTFNFGLTPELFPEQAVDFLLEHKFIGHIFNDMIGGSYLVWRYYPKEKVFVDGRTEVFGPQLFKDYISVYREPKTFESIARKYNIDYVLLNHSLGGRGKLIKYLLEDKNWALVYFDKTALVFIKNTKENKSFIDKYSVDINAFNNPNHAFWNQIYRDYQNKKWPGQELFPYGFLKVGYLFSDLEYLPLAEIAFKRAVELNSNFAMAYLALGNIYNQQKSYLLAISAYLKALSITPDSAEIYYNLGMIYEQQKLMAKAEKYYKKSISLAPRAYLAYYNLGFLYFDQNRFGLAAEQFKRAVKFNPGFAAGYSALGSSFANLGELSLAKKNFQKALSFTPEDKELHYSLGSVLLHMSKFNAAISEFQKVLSSPPDNITARHNLALSYLSVGLSLKAQQEWLIIKKQDPKNKLAQEYLKKLSLMGYEDALN